MESARYDIIYQNKGRLFLFTDLLKSWNYKAENQIVNTQF